MRWITAVVVAVATAAGVVALTSSAGGAPEPSSTVSALKTGTPTTLDTSARRSIEAGGFSVNTDAAVSVKAPNGGAPWTIVPGTEGGACLVMPNGVATCGGSALLRQSAIIGGTPDEAAATALSLPKQLDASDKDAPPTSSPAGSFTVRGLVSDDVKSASAVTNTGRAVGAVATVTDNVFELSAVPLDQAVSVRLTRADGTSSDIALP